MENTKDWLDDLKLRFGYGMTGNSEVPRITNFAYEYRTFPKKTNYDINGMNSSTVVGYRLDKYGNEDTKWEATQMYNVGLDGAGLEWYYKKTTDMLISAQYSALAGEPSKPYINFGDMKNTGVDFNFNYRDSKGDWSWDFSLNLSHYRMRLLRSLRLMTLQCGEVVLVSPVT